MPDKFTFENGSVNIHVFDNFVPKINEMLREHKFYPKIEGLEVRFIEKVNGNQPKLLYSTPDDFSQEQLELAYVVVRDVSKAFVKWHAENHI